MLRRALAAAAGALLAAGASAPALAWSEPTHQTTGAIAWLDLKAQHPAALAELLELIRQHPNYDLLEPVLAGLSPDQRERALFEVLARWPDDIRGGPEDRPEWHYQLRVVSGRTWLWPLENGAAQAGFTYNFVTLANRCAAPADRAKAIGWLIHIVGDVQQPLHAGHQMTEAFPMTDRAGELAFVKRPNGETVNLHYYWDNTMEGSGVALPAGFEAWADALAAKWPRSRLTRELNQPGDPLGLFRGYLDESAELARLLAYQGTYLRAAPDAAAAPQVTAQEQAVAIALAERRIATGGYRIADVLARAIALSRAPGTTCQGAVP
ncbi:MAG TPA: S1/P1 nuclease [Novosphingobium sp.]|nr:S1/P1 nuclease [Novosphingobium sp.]